MVALLAARATLDHALRRCAATYLLNSIYFDVLQDQSTIFRKSAEISKFDPQSMRCKSDVTRESTGRGSGGKRGGKHDVVQCSIILENLEQA